jgi:putative membrane protein
VSALLRTASPLEQEDLGDVTPEQIQVEERIAANDVARSALIGAIAGLAAGYVMNEFQNTWNRIKDGREKRHQHSGQHPKQEAGEPEDTTVKAASKISENIFGHELSAREKEVAGPVMHYAVSVLSGALYGAAAAVEPRVRTGFGTGFGTAVWLLADEIAVPASGLSRKPQDYPLSTHAYALVSHWVYGATTEAVYRTFSR